MIERVENAPTSTYAAKIISLLQEEIDDIGDAGCDCGFEEPIGEGYQGGTCRLHTAIELVESLPSKILAEIAKCAEKTFDRASAIQAAQREFDGSIEEVAGADVDRRVGFRIGARWQYSRDLAAIANLRETIRSQSAQFHSITSGDKDKIVVLGKELEQLRSEKKELIDGLKHAADRMHYKHMFGSEKVARDLIAKLGGE